MKKIVSFALAGLMVAGMAGSAWASGTENTGQIRVKELPGYQQLLDLREEGKSIRGEIQQERLQIREMLQEARQEKNKEAVAGLKEIRPSLQQLRQERKELLENQKNNWEAMREARKSGDQEQMESVLNQITSTRQDLNGKLAEIKTVTDEIMQVLQTSPESTEE